MIRLHSTLTLILYLQYPLIFQQHSKQYLFIYNYHGKAARCTIFSIYGRLGFFNFSSFADVMQKRYFDLHFNNFSQGVLAFFFTVTCACCKLSLVVWSMSPFISNIRNSIVKILEVLYRVNVMDEVSHDISSIILFSS